MDDEIQFAEDTGEEEFVSLEKWKVLIVDDEPEIHAVTKLALSDFVFLDRHLEFLSAHTGEEAKAMFEKHDDIAVVLLDVVMETDEAGLEVADYVRNELHNHYTRIILRTGQPGQAPERNIIINYDINDYKSKTELTSQKLFTVMISSLRSYRDISVIDENRRGLEKIIAASGDLAHADSLETFIDGVMQQLSSLLGNSHNVLYFTCPSAKVSNALFTINDLAVFCGKGDYINAEGQSLSETLSGESLLACQEALSKKDVVFKDDYLVAYCQSTSHHPALLFLGGLPRKLSHLDKRLVNIFSKNVQTVFDNSQ